MEAVGQLAGGIAHDFNNVLAAVTLTAELCLHQAPEGPVRDGLARILATAQSASGLTQQLLVFSRQQRVSPVPVDVGKAVDGVREILARTLGDNITLDLRVDPMPPVLLDPSQLEQIVLNLSINARDAMPQGGTLTIATSQVQLEPVDLAGVAAGLQPSGGAGLRPGRFAELRVGDTGTGMSREVRDRATEPFFTTKAGHGTGLGLAIVYGIVRAAGGALAIYSELGRGTVVRVLLPLAEQVPLQERAPTPAPVTGSGQRVLVVEDQTDLRDVIVEVLSGAGYHVESADAAELRDSLDDRVPVDLLVTDVVMPDVSGPVLAGAVEDTWPGTRVLFISGYTDGMLQAQGLTDETARLLVKPFTASTLLHTVAETLAADDPT
jgi:CheY-like chemotaxis protein